MGGLGSHHERAGKSSLKAVQDIWHELPFSWCNSECKRLDRHAALPRLRVACPEPFTFSQGKLSEGLSMTVLLISLLPPYRLTALPPYRLTARGWYQVSGSAKA